MTPSRIVTADRAPADRALLGGKGANLAAMSQAGLPVPPWICLTASANGLAASDREALLAAFDDAFGADAWVAVRSSALAEDSARDSFAGQLESFLYVARDDLIDRVERVLGSAASARAAAYREARGRGSEGPTGTAVLVQRMVDARVSGVLFTANPTTGDETEAVISAGLGLGEGVVADRVESDTLFCDLRTGEVRDRVTATKRARVVLDRDGGDGGTRAEPVPEAERDRPAIDDAQARELVALGRRIAERMGRPQDIEWAIDAAGALHLLQTRPITTLEREQLFDNSNIVESYPGLSSPLTFSFARGAYEETFRTFHRRLGVPPERLIEYWSIHANLIALIDGRIYYNILNWYRLFQILPGLEGFLPAWEKALGLRPRTARRRGPEPLGVRLRRLAPLGRILWRAVASYRRLDRDVRAYQETFRAVQADFRRHDLAALEAHELVELYDAISTRLLGGYAVSVLNDFFTQQLHEGVSKLIARWGLADDADALRNDLHCGEAGLESVEPVRSAVRLATTIRGDARLRALFEDADRDDDAVWSALRTDPALAGFRAEVDRHLALYGDRTVHELKLETPPLERQPAFLVRMLRNYVRGGQDVDAMERREREIRAAADARVAAALAGHPLRRALFGRVLAGSRRTVKHRENLRLLRSRAFGMVKRVFAALGVLLAREGMLAHPDDVFFLTVDEVTGAVRGHLTTRDLPALVALRRADYERFADRAPAPRVCTRGIVYARPFEAAAELAPGEADGEELRGLGCSPGRVRATARVVTEPRAGLDIHGEILVAPMTDPGWVFLMVAAGGLVVEKGSPLSHTAIIGRELGIPTVVAVEGATRRIADGRTIEIDGRAGTVRLVD